MLICIFNMVPVERKDFTIGLPLQEFTKKYGILSWKSGGGVWKEHNQTVQTQRRPMEKIMSRP